MKNTSTFPEAVEHKGCVASIYLTTHRGRKRYEVRCNVDGRMQRHTFKTYAQARKFATKAVRQIASDRSALVSLRGLEAVEYTHTRELLGGRKLTVLEAVRLALDITDRLAGKAEPRRVVDEWLHHQPTVDNEKRVGEVVQEMIKEKETSKETGDYHLRDLRCRLRAFVKAYDCPIRMVTQEQLNTYVLGQDVRPRTRRNVRNTLANLFNYAKARGYLSANHPGVPALPGKRKIRGEVAVYAPEELVSLLAAAKPKIALAMAITAFAGIRAAELMRLSWKHVNFEERHIEVPAVHAKTGVRRLVPITDNLLAWLEKYKEKDGPICTYVQVSNQYLKAAEEAGVKWKRNGLRHSYVSYRVAEIANIGQVALESGNSPQVIQADYLKVVTQKLAQRWFSIYPGEGIRDTEAKDSKPTG